MFDRFSSNFYMHAVLFDAEGRCMSVSTVTELKFDIRL